ncbi:hypothetical protein ACOMICROBIO_FLGHMIGD_01470 [Vibrio sp. B1FLJ16]|uniref:DUF6515 family protein n=1 Tax=Vibrio sp. B1FLJ16 TaxID=2751178 RepID=UPI0015F44FD4|nr:DUF6515 family protein [Vibrio sp. B1FLJ16]CAD7806061.1 hypothetical protein ACOMICROBIO_FLGHMIGD_01470 [Vibrio sp. B1FLJ16]CAE6901268.1 hypothetical protein ACOMICROBIO_FLGHMIGD_01470 [Vibrio sp. B1FLJ16]
MFKLSTFRNSAIALVMVSMVTPAIAKQPPGHSNSHGHKPQNPNNVVVVKPNHRPNHNHNHRPSHNAPSHRSYHRSVLPATAAFMMVAGITYAIIDNAYYKQSGDQYIYVEQPPVSSSQQVSSSQAGQVVDVLPSGVATVSVNGATYYVRGNDWYAPIAGTSRFVVVAPQV